MTQRQTFFLITVFVLVAVIVRLVPHAPNMTPMGALALMVGILLTGRGTWIIPMGVLFVTDLVLGGYTVPVMFAVYGSFALVTWMGRLLRSESRPLQVLVGSAGASLFFFFTTNFAVWAWTPMYEKTWDGLMLSYTLAIPFFRNMFVGDLIYTTVFLTLAIVVERISFMMLQYGRTAARH